MSRLNVLAYSRCEYTCPVKAVTDFFGENFPMRVSGLKTAFLAEHVVSHDWQIFGNLYIQDVTATGFEEILGMILKKRYVSFAWRHLLTVQHSRTYERYGHTGLV